jgi:hypothetical protein
LRSDARTDIVLAISDALVLAVSLNVPPWEDLHELSREELRLTNPHTDMVAQLSSPNAPVVELPPKSVQDRFVTTAAAASPGQE